LGVRCIFEITSSQNYKILLDFVQKICSKEIIEQNGHKFLSTSPKIDIIILNSQRIPFHRALLKRYPGNL
jgi:hypothetical protein